MPPDRRTLRSINAAFRTMAAYQNYAGQWVQWFRLNKSATISDPMFGTGPGRVWYTPVIVPVIDARIIRPPRNFDDDGLYLVDRAHLVLSYRAFFNTVLPDPDTDGKNHYGDRAGLDGVLYTVTDFIPQGRIASNFLTISVDLIQVAYSELNEDVVAPMFAGYAVTT
jgi:hypothetical protein